MVVIFGYSKLAAQIASKLKEENKRFIIIEPNEKESHFAIVDDFADKVYRYECFDDNELIELGIQNGNIKTLFCMHNDFNKNLFVTLSARNLNSDLQIISLSTNKNNTTKLKLAGATTTINPSEIAGMKIFRKIHKSIAFRILDDILYGNSKLKIEEIIIYKDTVLDGIYFKDLNINKDFNLILLGIKDIEIKKEFIFSSRGINHKIDAGDTIVVLGEKDKIQEFIEYTKKAK